ncbi:MAG: TonB-dependent receptor [Bacteroidales bacterium]|nr:TonB-dependent receptor [Bacteroidales bacterium]
MYQRQNITRVKMYGGELDYKYRINNFLSVQANYSFNHSYILQFSKKPALEGKMMKYSPKHQAFFGFTWKNKVFHSGFYGYYKSSQFLNDENTIKTDGFVTFDFSLSKNFMHEKFTVQFSIKDLMDQRHIETNEYLSPGRLVGLKMTYRFGN